MKYPDGSTLIDAECPSGPQTGQMPRAVIPAGTTRYINLTDAAVRLGVARVTAKRWWHEGKLLGCVSLRSTRSRVLIPIEVVEFYLRYRKLPTKRELVEAGVLAREFLLELTGPDGGLSETGASVRVTSKSR